MSDEVSEGIQGYWHEWILGEISGELLQTISEGNPEAIEEGIQRIQIQSDSIKESLNKFMEKSHEEFL